MSVSPFIFPVPLTEGMIVRRKTQFTILVEVAGGEYNCHCPTTSRIGNLDLAGRPCLLSQSTDPNRKTPYTVEAVSLNRQEDSGKSWIGINQNAANRYVEHYLVNNGFSDMVGTGGEVRREQFLGISKLDFLVGDIYLEVKTPLQNLQLPIPDYVKTKKSPPLSATERMVRHITELGNSLQDHQRAILLACFLYDNPGFQVVQHSANYEIVKSAVARSLSLGVEIWQANFKVVPERVSLERYFRINP